MMNVKDANTETPIPSKKWTQLDEYQRLECIKKLGLEDKGFAGVNVTRALRNGFVFVILVGDVKSSDRGELLLDLEAFLKEQVDQAITIWCEPIDDKNRLRNLRGIEVKSI